MIRPSLDTDSWNHSSSKILEFAYVQILISDTMEKFSQGGVLDFGF